MVRMFNKVTGKAGYAGETVFHNFYFPPTVLKKDCTSALSHSPLKVKAAQRAVDCLEWEKMHFSPAALKLKSLSLLACSFRERFLSSGDRDQCPPPWSSACQKSKRWVIESATLKRLNEVEWRQREITGFLSPQALKLIPSFLLYKFMRYRCYNKNFYVEYFISLIISASLFQSARGHFLFLSRVLGKARRRLVILAMTVRWQCSSVLLVAISGEAQALYHDWAINTSTVQ